MRQILIGQVVFFEGMERQFTCQYYLLVRTLSDFICCESFGVCVLNKYTGESCDIPDITVSPGRIFDLLHLLIHGQVTPCSLRDVVDDWL